MAIKLIRVQTRLDKSTEAKIRRYAAKRYNGNRELAVREACEAFVRRMEGETR
jgi:hypothetical protein